MTPFFDPLAAAIVVGGSAAAAALRSPLADGARALSALRVLPRRRFSADPLIAQIAAFAKIARRHGAMALDRSRIADPDLAAAVAMIVDGAAPAAVADHLQHMRRARTERHVAAAEVWAGAAEAAPAMGMIGTLVGLATLFATMGDPSTIGAAMATALLATLYGAILANLALMPVATRLRAAARAEAFERQRIEAPLLALAEQERPRIAVAPAPARLSVA